MKVSLADTQMEQKTLEDKIVIMYAKHHACQEFTTGDLGDRNKSMANRILNLTLLRIKNNSQVNKKKPKPKISTLHFSLIDLSLLPLFP